VYTYSLVYFYLRSLLGGSLSLNDTSSDAFLIRKDMSPVKNSIMQRRQFDVSRKKRELQQRMPHDTLTAAPPHLNGRVSNNR
jgi:hypothetical protein